MTITKEFVDKYLYTLVQKFKSNKDQMVKDLISDRVAEVKRTWDSYSELQTKLNELLKNANPYIDDDEPEPKTPKVKKTKAKKSKKKGRKSGGTVNDGLVGQIIDDHNGSASSQTLLKKLNTSATSLNTWFNGGGNKSFTKTKDKDNGKIKNYSRKKSKESEAKK